MIQSLRQPPHLVRDLELPLLEVARGEGVGQNAAFGGVILLVDDLDQAGVGREGVLVGAALGAGGRVAVDGPDRAGRGEGDGVGAESEDRVVLVGTVDFFGAEAAVAEDHEGDVGYAGEVCSVWEPMEALFVPEVCYQGLENEDDEGEG